MEVRQSYELAQKIVKKCGGSRNPEEMCPSLGIEIYEFDLKNLKGMYSSASRHRTIYLNSRLTGYLRRFVLMHELCHDQILPHRAAARNTPLRDLLFFEDASQTEREANSVAAHILIQSGQMLELLENGRSCSETASLLEVPEDLLLIELEDFTRMHPEYAFLQTSLPREGRGDFLKCYDDGTFSRKRTLA